MNQRDFFLAGLKLRTKVTLGREFGGTLPGEVVNRDAEKHEIEVQYEFLGERVESFDSLTGYNERGSVKILDPLDLRIREESLRRPKPIPTEGGGPRLRQLQLEKRKR